MSVGTIDRLLCAAHSVTAQIRRRRPFSLICTVGAMGITE
jgi:hypothetical protein